MDRLKANKSANFNDLTDLIHKLLKAAWGENWGIFTQRYPNGTNPASVKFPIITYHSKRKKPGAFGKNQEIKPRFREYYEATVTEGERPRKVNVYSQMFDHEVIFDVWAETNVEVDSLADRFEEFMMTYTGFLLSEGVQQIILLEQSDETDSVKIRDNAVVRSFRYLVRLEKHVEVPTSVIQEVIGSVSILNANELDNSIDKQSIKF